MNIIGVAFSFLSWRVLSGKGCQIPAVSSHVLIKLRLHKTSSFRESLILFDTVCVYVCVCMKSMSAEYLSRSVLSVSMSIGKEIIAEKKKFRGTSSYEFFPFCLSPVFTARPIITFLFENGKREEGACIVCWRAVCWESLLNGRSISLCGGY